MSRLRNPALVVWGPEYRVSVENFGEHFGVELVVNGSSAGLVDAVPRWQDYEFPVTVQQLRPGFNEFELRFNAENDDLSKRLVLAVYSLKLTATAREETP